MTTPKFHGASARGLETTPRSESFEGRFGRMFHSLSLYPAKFGKDDKEVRENLHKLAVKMVALAEDEPTPETEIDDEENQGIDAGYTYLGQFIDHDLTFDPMSSLAKQNDPNGLIDFRSPRFDLDNVYGRGPDDQPYLYQGDGMKLLLGRRMTGNPHDPNARDLPRNNPDPLNPPPPVNSPARALIGDPRNDENVIVSQLQVSMIRFHNHMVDVMTAEAAEHGQTPPTFEQVQQQVRWHYQWVVLHDFLPTIVRKDVLKAVLPKVVDGHAPTAKEYKDKLKFYRWENEPFIPVEFAVAAYRFGHSMIRPVYRLNTTLPNRQTIFTDPVNDPGEFLSLRGFREFPDSWAVDWDLFFGSGKASQPTSGPERVQKSYKIDTSLVNPLGKLPVQVASLITSLAERNLVRGWTMGLPSGQKVAQYMGLKPLTDEKLLVGKGTKAFDDNTKHPTEENKDEQNVTLASLSPVFKGNAPLWFYILAEARNASFTGDDNATFQLGEVGGRIVAEVFIGLLVGDIHSYIYQNPGWRPRPDFMTGDHFKMADLLKQSLKG